jgi:hypothetical protein
MGALMLVALLFAMYLVRHAATVCLKKRYARRLPRDKCNFSMNCVVFAVDLVLMFLIIIHMAVSIETIHYDSPLVKNMVIALVFGVDAFALIPVFIRMSVLKSFFYWGNDYIEYYFSFVHHPERKVRLKKDEIEEITRDKGALIIKSKSGADHKIRTKSLELLNGFAIIIERMNELAKGIKPQSCAESRTKAC